MHILLTNDDGIHSAGIFVLYSYLKKAAKVSVVAPEVGMSAVGHAITLSRPLRVKEIKRAGRAFGFAVDGTPADCVKIAVTALLAKDKPDLVVSGINLGPNVGFHVIYSGTVSAATEGLILGVPSIAVSINAFYDECRYESAARFTLKMIDRLRRGRILHNTVLNVNVPNLPYNKIKGVKVTHQAHFTSVERYSARRDPRGNLYYWLRSELIKKEGDGDTDRAALRRGYISVTPLKFDMTNYHEMDRLKKIFPETKKC